MCRNCFKQKPKMLPVPKRNRSSCMDCQDCLETDSRFNGSNKWFYGNPCNVCGHGKSSHYYVRPNRWVPRWSPDRRLVC